MKVRLLPVKLAAIVGCGMAAAATSTANFNVTLEIVGECNVNAVTDLDFGTSGVIDANIDTTSTITIQCTSSTPYTVGLSLGSGVGATVTTRYMTGPGAQLVGYGLYRDALRSQAWGTTIGVNTAAATGNGAAQIVTVYGRVAPQTTPGVGAYSDIVTATVTY